MSMDQPLCPGVQQVPSFPGAQPHPEDLHHLAVHLLRLYQVLPWTRLIRVLLQVRGNPEDLGYPSVLPGPRNLLGREAPGLPASLLRPLDQVDLAHPARQFHMYVTLQQTSDYAVTCYIDYCHSFRKFQIPITDLILKHYLPLH